MVCWYFALHQLPLAKAYALLSLSYILVWAAAIWLPGWHEPFHWRSLLGVLDYHRRRADNLLAGEAQNLSQRILSAFNANGVGVQTARLRLASWI